MKKLLCLILSVILLVFVTGCTDQDDSSSQSNSSVSQSSQSYSSNSQSSSNVSSSSSSKSNKTSKPNSSSKSTSSNKTKPQDPISNTPVASVPEESSSQAPIVTPSKTPEIVPPEIPEKQADGILYTSTMYNIDLDNYPNVYPIELDKDATQFALYTDGLIKNFTITKVSMDFDTLKYKDEEQIFSLDTFDTDTAVVIRTFFSDTASHLKVTYTTDTGTIVRYLYQSGKDDSILLIEN